MEKVKPLFEVCEVGYLRCKGAEALLKTPEAQRQLAAVERLAAKKAAIGNRSRE